MHQTRKRTGKNYGSADDRIVAGYSPILDVPTHNAQHTARKKGAANNSHQGCIETVSSVSSQALIDGSFGPNKEISTVVDPQVSNAMHHGGHKSAPLPDAGVRNGHQPTLELWRGKSKDRSGVISKPKPKPGRAPPLSQREPRAAVMRQYKSNRLIDHIPVVPTDQENISHLEQDAKKEAYGKSTFYRHQDHQSSATMKSGILMVAGSHILRNPDVYRKSRNTLSQVHPIATTNVGYLASTNVLEASGHVNSKHLASSNCEKEVPMPGAYDDYQWPASTHMNRYLRLAQTQSLLPSNTSRSTGNASATAANDDDMELNKEAAHGTGSSTSRGSSIGDSSMAKPRSNREDLQSPQTPSGQPSLGPEDAIMIEDLKTQVYKYQQECAQVREMWRSAVDDLIRFRQESTSKVDDEFISTAYREMIFDVQHWAETYCYMDPGLRLTTQAKIHLERLAPAWRKFVSCSARHVLIESILMNWLSREVLTSGIGVGLWWAGGLQEGMSLLCAQLDPSKFSVHGKDMHSLLLAKDDPSPISNQLNKGHLNPSYVKEYAAWRARTAHLVSKSVDNQHVEANVTAVSAELEVFLSPFVIAEKKESAWSGLRTIVRQAFSLDEDLCKSRALFNAHNWDNETVLGCKFDETIMESPIGSQPPHPGMMVDLVLAPALSKTGTADGDMYEKTSFISKWIVICSEPSGTVG
jgi:hypothetical protein